MKILIVNTVDFKVNGISTVIMNYYKNMRKENIIIDFLSIGDIDKEYKKEMEIYNSHIYTLDRKGNPIKYFFELKKILKRNKYDIIHIHGNSSTMAIETLSAFISGIPVRIVHSHNTTCTHKIAHKVLYPILKNTYTNGVACGEEAGKWLFKEQEFKVIKNGIDLSKFKFSEEKRMIYREKINANGRTVIGHIGNFVYQKNHKFLLETFSEVLKKDSNYILLLIGDGELIKELKEKAIELKIEKNVIFLGKTKNVVEYLSAMDIFVLPSHFEGLPLVLIEAQAVGLKFLASDKVSKESKITDLGKFLTIDNINVWVEEILKYKKYDRSCMAKQNHKAIKRAGYDISINALEIQKLYEKFIIDKQEYRKW